MSPPPPSPDAVETLFAEYLERVEAGESADFTVFCAAHPSAAAELQRLYRRWSAMSRAFAALSTGGPPSPTPPTPSPTIDELVQRLARGGARIERYALGPEIARGAMGRIVQAWDSELRREVALKVQRGDATDARSCRRFLEEAQIAAQLDHPGIVPIHELGLDTDGRPFFSMQLVRGLDLDRILALAHGQHDGWSRTRVLNVLLRASEAIAFAHSRGVVHRDLKPANIMVGAFHETYVMDWGLARVAARGTGDDDLDTLRAGIAAEAAGSPLLTGGGDVIGTPAYMAPEQAARGIADTAVDVYALGAILYHLLAGHRPYADRPAARADDVLALLAAGPPTALGDGAPAELRAICERAMARDPAARYASVAEFAEDLRAYLEVRTVRAYATGRFADLRKWLARNRAFALSCTLLLLALVAGTTVATALWMRAEYDRERADATARRLAAELDRSTFRSARLALQVDNSNDAAAALWRTHLLGRLPRATSWALLELAERDPFLTTLPLHQAMLPVAFAAAADVVLVGAPDGRLQVHDPLTLAQRRVLGTPGPAVTSVAAAATWCVVGDHDGGITVFDLASGVPQRRRVAHRGRVTELLTLPAGGFVSAGDDGRVLHWQTIEAEPVPKLEFAAGVGALACRPTDGALAAGDQGGRVRVTSPVDPVGWSALASQRQVLCLAFGDSADELWAGCTDHTIRRLRRGEPGPDRTVPTRNGSCRQLVRDADGSLLAAGWWRIDRFAPGDERPQPLALRGASSIALQSARRLLVTAGASSGLGLLDLGTGDRRAVRGQSVALAADGSRIATLEDDAVVVRDVETDALVASWPAPGAACVQLSPDGSVAALTDLVAGRVHFVDVANGRERFTVAAPAEVPFREACSFAPDGAEVTVRVAGHRLERRDARTGALLAAYELADAQWIRTRYSGDGRWLGAIRRNAAAVWCCDLRRGIVSEFTFTIERPGELPGSLSALAWSHDGARLAVGTWQGQVLVRDATGTTQAVAAHGGTIWSLEFAATDAGLLFSAGGSQGVAAWDLDTGECCHQAVRDHATSLQLSRDLRTLACATPDGALLLDLTYRQRHVAGNLAYQLERQRGRTTFDPARVQELQQWAAAVLERPWPRWR